MYIEMIIFLLKCSLLFYVQTFLVFFPDHTILTYYSSLMCYETTI